MILKNDGYSRFFTLTLFVFIVNTISIKSSIAQIYEPVVTSVLSGDEALSQLEYHHYKVELNSIKEAIKDAPKAGKSTPSSQKVIDIMLPSGQLQKIKVEDAPVTSVKQAQQYPDMKSYQVQGVIDKSITGRICLTPRGLSGMLFMDGATFFIENLADGTHISYEMDRSIIDKMSCEVEEVVDKFETNSQMIRSKRSSGSELRVYKMAVTTTDEFKNEYGPDLAGINAKIMEHLTNLNALYEHEFSISFSLISGNDVNITNNAGLSQGNRTGTAHAVISGNIAAGAYDIGHAFHFIAMSVSPGSGSNGGSGLAGLGVVCNDSRKAEGWTGAGAAGTLASTLNAVFLGIFAHEVGHQFNANHSYYGTASSCAERSPGNGYEPGSGNTVMSYEGSCDASDDSPTPPCPDNHNIEPEVSSVYFHTHSIHQILDFADSETCEFSNTASNNNIPVITSMPTNFTIPKGTPFELIGTATDGDGDVLQYNWEEYDTDDLNPSCSASHPDAAATSMTAPLFRSLDPSTSGGTRYFPDLSNILSNTHVQGEILPQVSRPMKFRLTVRDNHVNGGGLDCEEMTVTVDGTTGPFEVTAPNGAPTWNADGSTDYTVSWNANGSEANCSKVDILLSVNGGLTFPYVLKTDVNNAAESTNIQVPSVVVSCTNARIKVRCASQTSAAFFDISDTDFIINSNCTADGGYLCPGTTVSADEGDAALNLNMVQFAGSPFGATRSVVVTSGDNDGQLEAAIKSSSTDNTCDNRGFNRNVKRIQFQVTESGNYTFDIDGFVVMTLFNTPINTGDLCDTYITSNTYTTSNGSFGQSDGALMADLLACTTYELVVHSLFGDVDTNLYSSGLGEVVIIDGTTTGTYNYLLVRNSDKVIQSVLNSTDLTNEVAGDYTFYGINAASGSLSSLLNTSFTDVYSTLESQGICANISNTAIPVNIIGETPLPIEFLTLQAEKVSQTTILNWKTAGQSEGATFRVLRSTGSKNFIEIGTVEAKRTETANYTWNDIKPNTGYNYYKIELLEKDGRTHISNIVSIDFAGSNNAMIYPNPIQTNQFRLDYEAQNRGQLSVKIEDSRGHQIGIYNFEAIEGLNQYDLNLTKNAPAGVYIIRLTYTSGNEQVLRLVKM